MEIYRIPSHKSGKIEQIQKRSSWRLTENDQPQFLNNMTGNVNDQQWMTNNQPKLINHHQLDTVICYFPDILEIKEILQNILIECYYLQKYT